jgi:hypothetical protein
MVDLKYALINILFTLFFKVMFSGTSWGISSAIFVLPRLKHPSNIHTNISFVCEMRVLLVFHLTFVMHVIHFSKLFLMIKKSL